MVAAGFEAAKKGIEEFAQQEVATTKLDQALIQAGTFTDEYREKLQALGHELQETTGIAQDRWLAVLARLEQFGANSSNIEEYSKAVENLAGLMGGNVERAGIIFSRVISGNTGVLQRYGIQIDKNATQHEQIEQAMRQLAERGGGQLAAQTGTLTGQFTALEHATGDVFRGIGNLISRTGILQVGLAVLTKTLELVGDLFPKTVAKMEGAANKLPTVGSAFHDLGDEAGDAGGDMAEMGTSAEGAVDGVEKLSKEAQKAKESFEKAAGAAKELRERQDQLADAATAEKLAKVKVREANQKITPQEADRERAGIRADAEREKYERKIAEQDRIIEAANQRINAAETDATAKGAAQARAEAERRRQEQAIISQYGGLPGVENVNPASIKEGVNPYDLLAEGQINKAADARDKAWTLRSSQAKGDEGAPARLEAEAKAAEALAAKYRDLASTLKQSTTARIDARSAQKEDANVYKEVGKDLEKARDARSAAQTEQHAAGLTASAEAKVRERETERKQLEEENKELEKRIRRGIDPAGINADRSRYDSNLGRINQLQYGADPEALRRANYLKQDSPSADQRKKYNEQQIETIDRAIKTDAELRKLLEQPPSAGASKESREAKNFNAEQLRQRGLMTPEERKAAAIRRERLQNANAAESEREDAPEVRRQEDFNRYQEQRGSFGQDVAIGGAPQQDIIALGERARTLVESTGKAAPGTSSEVALKNFERLLAQVEKEGGNNQETDRQLARVMEQFSTSVQARLLNTASKDELKRVISMVEQLTRETRNRR